MKKLLFSAILLATTGIYAQVGIGTQNPQGIFNVDGASDNAATGVPTTAQQANDFTVLATGYVGIGTASPLFKLHVEETINNALFRTLFRNAGTTSRTDLEIRATGGGSLYVGTDGSGTFYGAGAKAYIENRSGGRLVFSSNSENEHMTLSTSGNLGIGTASPTARLDVVGSVRIADGSQAVGRVLTSNADGLSTWAAIPSSADNLGNHTATTTLNLANNSVTNGNYITSGAATTGNIELSPGSATQSGYLRIRNGSAASLGYIGYDNTNLTYQAENGARHIFNGGNVGIGTSTPNAPLQFSNGVVNRKIVLYETVNNDNQYFGFGINDGQLRYQIDDTNNAHTFYAGSGATTSNELMRIQGNGNVGIGTASPTAKLDVVGSVRIADGSQAVGRVLTSDGAGNATWTAVASPASDGDAWGVTGEDQTSSISRTGNVGIGTASPNAPLQFSQTYENRKIVLHERANNDHQFLGFGVKTYGGSNTEGLSYHIDDTASAHIFYSGLTATTSREIMRIQGDGIVGLNTNVPESELTVRMRTNNRIGISLLNSAGINAAGFGTYASGHGYMRVYNGLASSDPSIEFSAVSSGNSYILTGNFGIGTNLPKSKFAVVGLPVYADNIAAQSGGLDPGDFYRDASGTVKVRF